MADSKQYINLRYELLISCIVFNLVSFFDLHEFAKSGISVIGTNFIFGELPEMTDV